MKQVIKFYSTMSTSTCENQPANIEHSSHCMMKTMLFQV